MVDCRCPECGRTFDPNDVRTFNKEPLPRPWRKAAPIPILVGLVALVVVPMLFYLSMALLHFLFSVVAYQGS